MGLKIYIIKKFYYSCFQAKPVLLNVIIKTNLQTDFIISFDPQISTLFNTFSLIRLNLAISAITSSTSIIHPPSHSSHSPLLFSFLPPLHSAMQHKKPAHQTISYLTLTKS